MKIFHKSLDKFEKEPEINIVEEQVTYDIEEVINTFNSWMEDMDYLCNRPNIYASLEKYDQLPDTQEKIQRFIVHEIKELEYGRRYYLGMFISYCVNEVYEGQEIELSLNEPVNYLGWFTKKNWIINGVVGDRLGQEIISGNIIVNGNAGDYLGGWMKDGRIELNGCAGYHVGHDKKGGDIHLNDEYGSIGAQRLGGGKIYHKGKLIVNNDW